MCDLRLLTLFVVIHAAMTAQSIREIDFKNHDYPLSGALLGHSNMQWLDEKGRYPKPPIHLMHGRAMSDDEGFTLESVTYGDVTGDGAEEAIVDLKYHSGGTQTTDYLYVFQLDQGQIKLLAFCHTGSRAYSGLYRGYAENGQFAVELFDPEKQQGDCCSTGVVVTRYVWTGTRFEIRGKVQKRDLPPLIEHK